IAGYLLAVMVAGRRRPGLAPKVGQVQPMTRRDAISVGAVLALFGFIMGGIYGGFFTPIEAAGMGAGAALLIAFATGGLSRQALWTACLDSATASAMIFAIIIGAEIFSNFITFAGLPDGLTDMVSQMGLSPWTVLVVIVLIYVVLGCFLESLSMILLTVPVFYPLVSDLDFGLRILQDPDAVLIWFAIIVVVVTEISLITPPIGMNVFVLRSVLPDVSLATIFRGVFVFWVADIVRLALIIGLPVLSLYLVTP
ncbi:MAG: TRAP transporter large permease subunit, partial [Paracoccus sp. (in: a-proteobacteria)]|nr:TRAP transporter large permease subunit [Paracoccus sp. (in: a-proteobacteria)]